MLELSDVTRARGPDSTVHYVRFIFLNAIVFSKGRTKPDPQANEFMERTIPFRLWIRKAHPEALKVLTSAPRVLKINREAGALTSQLLAEWVALGRPGS